ncbi:MAG: hypothetical protein U0694_19440 [Anaerolineae bacterium]
MLKKSAAALTVIALVAVLVAFGSSAVTFAQEATPTPSGSPMMNNVDNLGEAWTASGTITALDFHGITLQLEDSTTVYVMLGPSSYWSAQGVTLAVGDVVTIVGYANGEYYHAATVTLADGTVLTLRDENGVPLWAGTMMGGQYGNGTCAQNAQGGMMGNQNGGMMGNQNGGMMGNQNGGMMGGPHHDDDENFGHHHMGR